MEDSAQSNRPCFEKKIFFHFYWSQVIPIPSGFEGLHPLPPMKWPSMCEKKWIHVWNSSLTEIHRLSISAAGNNWDFTQWDLNPWDIRWLQTKEEVYLPKCKFQKYTPCSPWGNLRDMREKIHSRVQKSSLTETNGWDMLVAGDNRDFTEWELIPSDMRWL